MPRIASNTADCHKADDQHVERAHAAMHEHLVDHDLKEQRRDERKYLQEERGDEHLAEQMSILVDRADKPSDVEAAGEVRQCRAARHQDEAAVPDRFKLQPGSSLRVGAMTGAGPEPCHRRPCRGSGNRHRAARRSRVTACLAAGPISSCCARALSPSSFAQRNISVTPIVAVPQR